MFVVNLRDGRFDCGRTRTLQSSRPTLAARL